MVVVVAEGTLTMVPLAPCGGTVGTCDLSKPDIDSGEDGGVSVWMD